MALNLTAGLKNSSSQYFKGKFHETTLENPVKILQGQSTLKWRKQDLP
jgi:hypothetical protein